MAMYAGQWGPQPFIDEEGTAVPAATVLVLNLDNTLAELFADRAKTTPLANPLPTGVLDGQPGLGILGNGTFYAEPGRYTMIVTVAGAEVFRGTVLVPADPEEALEGANAAALVAAEAATRSAADAAAAAADAAAIAARQPLDADLTALAALTTRPFGRALLEAEDASSARAAIGAQVAGVYATVTQLDTALIDAGQFRGVLPHKLGLNGDEPGPFVSWGLDDGYADSTDFFDLLDARGIKGTFFATATFFDKAGIHPTWGVAYPTTAQGQAIADAGHEFGYHGWNHEDQASYLATNGVAALNTLISNSVGFLESTFGVQVTTAAYPAGISNARTREIMGRHFDYARGTKGVVSLYAPDPYDVPAVDVQALTEAAIIAIVDQAVATRSMVNFLVHGGLTAPILTKLGNVMDYIAGLDPSLGVAQGTFGDGMRARASLKGSAGMFVDNQGNGRFETLRATRLLIGRTDLLADYAYIDLDENTNALFFDAAGGPPPEFRKGFLAKAAVYLGDKPIRVGDGVTTLGSATLDSQTAMFSVEDVGRTVSGAGIPGGTTIAAYVNATRVTMSAAATVTAANVVLTFGRVVQSTTINGDLVTRSNVRIEHHAGAAVNFRILGQTVDQGSISPTTWKREGTGGGMVWDTGTGGSNADVKAFRLRFIDHTGARKVALASAAPTDATINAGEIVLWPDPTNGAGKLMLKMKTTDGTVVSGSVALV